MAAAPLKAIVNAEASCATLFGAVVVLWPAGWATRMGLPAVPESWAMIRLAGLLLLVFGVLLWTVRDRALIDRQVLRGLAVSHGVVGVLLTLQAIAVWDSGFGALLAIAPLALAFRYAQYLFRATPAEPARG